MDFYDSPPKVLEQKMTIGHIRLEDIDIKALSHRRALGFTDDQAVDIVTLLSKIKAKYKNFDYVRVSDWQHAEIEAFWNPETKRIHIPEKTFCEANDLHFGIRSKHHRSRMTIMHEVSHALLGHKQGILFRAPSGNKAEKHSNLIRKIEREARRYAASFLVPHISQNILKTAQELSDQYDVSLQAAEIRLEEMKRL